jgi:hypothetical protein
MTFKFSFHYKDGDFTKAQLLAEQKVAAAMTAGMREAADLAKTAARQSIAAGGFSDRWQNALRAEVFPKSGVSLHPAASIWHNISYADVFEEGKTIEGHPLEWIPTDAVPHGPGGKHLTPKEMVGVWGKLITINVPGKPPMLAAAIRETDALAGKRLKLKTIRTGGHRRGKVHVVILYIGKPSVTDPKKFDVIAAVEGVAAQFPDLVIKNLED